MACALGAALALGSTPLGAAAEPASPTQPALTVAGDGTVSRSPDEARIAVEIVTNDGAASRSGSENTAIYNGFVARVGTLGIAATDVRTTSYNVAFVPYPPKDLPAEQRQPRYGYITSRSLSVLVTPLENAGKVVDAATAAGVTQIGDVGFELKDRHAAFLAALAAAMRDARATAAALAAAGDFRIARIRNVASTDERPLQPYPAVMRAAALAPAGAPTEIVPGGPIDVTAHVTVTYDIR